MPGEMITEESRPVLEFLQMLCEIGAHYRASNRYPRRISSGGWSLHR
ncbi:Lysine decarboxylase, inducible [Raoultella terrigena]|uniref:Lysine decarboxylase, inducible n=1 Tax=Raoultella terrigena TaxID=577 RepID=A0A3P8M421_RAOTE|nr:Lysine decarboxylase, inducible [Raoultella terrigena]